MELTDYADDRPRHVVLIGGGHANVQVMIMLAQSLQPKDNTCVTLVSNYRYAYYSGMMPGCVAGLYDESEARMDLEALSKWCGMSFVCASVERIDRDERVIHTDNDEHFRRIPYDYVAINIGSTTRGITDTPGVAEYTLPTRPISEFMGRITAFEHRFFDNNNHQPRRRVRAFVVGGGAAGVELCLTLQARWQRHRHRRNNDDNNNGSVEVEMTLVDDHAQVLENMGPAVCRVTTRALNNRRVRVLSESRVISITEERLQVRTRGIEATAEYEYDVIVWATGAAAHNVSQHFDIECTPDYGYIRVHRTMQSVSDDRVLAAGDCCAIDDCPYVTKAGVYAVRQGPVVGRNLLAMLRQRLPLEMYVPQHSFLALLADGDGAAIIRYKSYSFHARWCWWLKDWIDRGFMKKFNTHYLGERIAKLTPFYADDHIDHGGGGDGGGGGES